MFNLILNHINRSAFSGLLLAGILLLTACYEQPKQQWQQADYGLYAAALSADGQYALVATVDHGALLWDLPANKLKHAWRQNMEHETSQDIVFTAIARHAPYALTATHDAFAIWDMNSGELKNQWYMHANITSIALSSHGNIVLVGLNNFTAQLIDSSTGYIMATFDHPGYVNAVALSQDDHYVLTGSDDHQARLWHIPSQQLIHNWPHTASVTQVTFSPNTKHALTAAGPYEAFIWNTQTGEQQHQLTLHGPLAHQIKPAAVSIRTALFSKEGDQLITGSPPRFLRLWDVQSGKLMRTWSIPKRTFWKPPGAIIYALAFADNEQTIITESSDGMGYAWQMP